jgi:hypothetical protein
VSKGQVRHNAIATAVSRISLTSLTAEKPTLKLPIQTISHCSVIQAHVLHSLWGIVRWLGERVVLMRQPFFLWPHKSDRLRTALYAAGQRFSSSCVAADRSRVLSDCGAVRLRSVLTSVPFVPSLCRAMVRPIANVGSGEAQKGEEGEEGESRSGKSFAFLSQLIALLIALIAVLLPSPSGRW